LMFLRCDKMVCAHL